MTDRSTEERIARLERVVRGISSVLVSCISLGVGIGAGALVQAEWFGAPLNSPWHWQSALALLAAMLGTASFLRKVIAALAR
ncbi:MAG TPA: hypothetical protein VLU23_04040 [Pseudolabrys sp.]|nr:hypothetical protein [Pseudolabrys sp.]